MSNMFEEPIDKLLDADTRDKFEVAYLPAAYEPGEGWLATGVDYVREHPDKVRWLTVDYAREVGELVVVDVDGESFSAFPGYPIVLRERT